MPALLHRNRWKGSSACPAPLPSWFITSPTKGRSRSCILTCVCVFQLLFLNSCIIRHLWVMSLGLDLSPGSINPLVPDAELQPNPARLDRDNFFDKFSNLSSCHIWSDIHIAALGIRYEERAWKLQFSVENSVCFLRLLSTCWWGWCCTSSTQLPLTHKCPLVLVLVL